MKKIYTYTFIVISALVLLGCAKNYAKSIEELNENFRSINYQNGISETEAIAIAQNHLLTNPPKENPAKSDIAIFKVLDSYEHQSTYRVNFDFIFKDKKPFMYPFFWAVVVNKNTGEVSESRFGGHK